VACNLSAAQASSLPLRFAGKTSTKHCATRITVASTNNTCRWRTASPAGLPACCCHSAAYVASRYVSTAAKNGHGRSRKFSLNASLDSVAHAAPTPATSCTTRAYVKTLCKVTGPPGPKASTAIQKNPTHVSLRCRSSPAFHRRAKVFNTSGVNNWLINCWSEVSGGGSSFTRRSFGVALLNRCPARFDAGLAFRFDDDLTILMVGLSR
jgi:hypothetical protein